jgi:tRNA threonylcarbamoyladenosine biosynthesis protein TsaE
LNVLDEAAMLALGRQLIVQLQLGDLLSLSGPLGAGKTTLVRGMLAGIGFDGPVRSPTYNLMVPYETEPPVLHADLYRLGERQVRETGIEDYLDSHICVVEWLPDGTLEPSHTINIDFAGDGRHVTQTGFDLSKLVL